MAAAWAIRRIPFSDRWGFPRAGQGGGRDGRTARDDRERIRADHRTALERIAELEHRAGGARDDTRAPVFAPMMTDIPDHMAIEDEFVSRLLAREREGWIESSRREHELIRGHLAVLGSGGAPAPDWVARLREMKRLIERHAGEEERGVLPELEMMYDLERLRDLGDEYARWNRGSR